MGSDGTGCEPRSTTCSAVMPEKTPGDSDWIEPSPPCRSSTPQGGISGTPAKPQSVGELGSRRSAPSPSAKKMHTPQVASTPDPAPPSWLTLSSLRLVAVPLPPLPPRLPLMSLQSCVCPPDSYCACARAPRAAPAAATSMAAAAVAPNRRARRRVRGAAIGLGLPTAIACPSPARRAPHGRGAPRWRRSNAPPKARPRARQGRAGARTCVRARSLRGACGASPPLALLLERAATPPRTRDASGAPRQRARGGPRAAVEHACGVAWQP
mmetsp:Transcript_1906/g.5468  ORF Transcript_1906/g.5468 Transcript_1906/m.5468 type:complete len:268 (-) Transcript_1906:16-819(-)